MTRCSLLAALISLFVLACGAPTAEPVPSAHFIVPEALAATFADALDVWAAAPDAPSVDMVISDSCDTAAAPAGTWCVLAVPAPFDCEGVEAVGCTTYAEHVVRIALQSNHADTLVSTAAHEIGHALFLRHAGDGSLMDPARSQAARLTPVVGGATLQAWLKAVAE